MKIILVLLSVSGVLFPLNATFSGQSIRPNKLLSAVLPSISSFQKDLFLRSESFSGLMGDSETYQVGSEWGKKPVTISNLESYSAPFKRAALATARVGGGTSFYLGKFNNHFVMATNHHVMPNSNKCSGKAVTFPLLKLSFKCVAYFGTWQSIDLSLFAIDVETKEQESTLNKVAKNFDFVHHLTKGQALITIGFGIANNPLRLLMGNQDSDCKVFSEDDKFRLMADPDDINPGPYKAWSFANACDISHGDSGSAMVDRLSGNVLGIIWTGKIPKSHKIQNTAYLDQLFQSNSPEIWKELSYAVPASKIREVLGLEIEKGEITDRDVEHTLKDLLGQN